MLHTFLLLLGTSLLGLSKAIAIKTVGLKVIAAALSALGAATLAFANRACIPVLKKLPRFLPQGSPGASVLSVLLLILGTAASAFATAEASWIGMAWSIVVQFLGGAILLFFDRGDLTGGTSQSAGGTVPGFVVTVWLGLGLAGLCGSCATTSGTTPTGQPVVAVPAQIAADCGAPVLRDEATHLVDDVASALQTSTNWQQALQSLGNAQYDRLKGDTWPAIKCAIADVMGQTDMQLAARAIMDPDAVDLTTRRHDRAAQWLKEHPAPSGS